MAKKKRVFKGWAVVFVAKGKAEFIHAYLNKDFAEIGLLERKIAMHKEKCAYKVMPCEVKVSV